MCAMHMMCKTGTVRLRVTDPHFIFDPLHGWNKEEDPSEATIVAPSLSLRKHIITHANTHSRSASPSSPPRFSAGSEDDAESESDDNADDEDNAESDEGTMKSRS